jgi:hypothetical protein
VLTMEIEERWKSWCHVIAIQDESWVVMDVPRASNYQSNRVHFSSEGESPVKAAFYYAVLSAALQRGSRISEASSISRSRGTSFRFIGKSIKGLLFSSSNPHFLMSSPCVQISSPAKKSSLLGLSSSPNPKAWIISFGTVGFSSASCQLGSSSFFSPIFNTICPGGRHQRWPSHHLRL